VKIKEIHSSDLTAGCMRYVQLRLQGKVKPVATGALFRGLVAGEALRYLHERVLHDASASDPALFTPFVTEAIDSVRKTLKDEGRQISEATEASMSDTASDIAMFCENYHRKLKARFARCQFLGCEVPVRWKFAPRMPEFASHIDLLLRDEAGRLVFLDWKLRETAPTWHYLSRNMQFGCYFGCCLEGKFLLNDGLSTEWKHIGEESRGVWLHVNHLAPFGRKTTCEDDRGIEREFVKGDDRPMRMAWREVEYSPGAVENIRAELMMRVKMMKKDQFPTNPDPVGCSLCEAESFCTRFDMLL
jgi:hypothetical protein